MTLSRPGAHHRPGTGRRGHRDGRGGAHDGLHARARLAALLRGLGRRRPGGAVPARRRRKSPELVADAGVAEEYRCITVDQRGFGQSPDVSGGPGPASLATDASRCWITSASRARPWSRNRWAAGPPSAPWSGARALLGVVVANTVGNLAIPTSPPCAKLAAGDRRARRALARRARRDVPEGQPAGSSSTPDPASTRRVPAGSASSGRLTTPVERFAAAGGADAVPDQRRGRADLARAVRAGPRSRPRLGLRADRGGGHSTYFEPRALQSRGQRVPRGSPAELSILGWSASECARYCRDDDGPRAWRSPPEAGNHITRGAPHAFSLQDARPPWVIASRARSPSSRRGPAGRARQRQGGHPLRPRRRARCCAWTRWSRAPRRRSTLIARRGRRGHRLRGRRDRGTTARGWPRPPSSATAASTSSTTTSASSPLQGLEVTEEEWDRMLAVNLTTMVLTTQAALPHLEPPAAGRSSTSRPIAALRTYGPRPPTRRRRRAIVVDDRWRGSSGRSASASTRSPPARSGRRWSGTLSPELRERRRRRVAAGGGDGLGRRLGRRLPRQRRGALGDRPGAGHRRRPHRHDRRRSSAPTSPAAAPLTLGANRRRPCTALDEGQDAAGDGGDPAVDVRTDATARRHGVQAVTAQIRLDEVPGLPAFMKTPGTSESVASASMTMSAKNRAHVAQLVRQ